MKITAREIFDIIGGELVGDKDAVVNGFSKIEELDALGTLTFLANLKYAKYIYTTVASVVIVPTDFEPTEPLSLTLIKVVRPYVALSMLMEHWDQKTQNAKQGVESTAVIADRYALPKDIYVGHCSVIETNVSFGKNVRIASHVLIESGVVIGDDVVIMEGVKIKRDSQIGSQCKIHPQVVIGSDGFGFAQGEDGEYRKIPHLGNVIIEDEVEVGVGTVIDKASMGSTRIGKGVKLDNLIQIGHNVEIGDHTVMAAQSGVSGSVKIGKNCMVGGQVGFAGHITIGDRVMIAAKSGVLGNVPNDSKIQGYPAFEIRNFYRSSVIFRKLPRWVDKMNFIEKVIKKSKADESEDA